MEVVRERCLILKKEQLPKEKGMNFGKASHKNNLYNYNTTTG